MFFLSPFTESSSIPDPRFSARGAARNRQGPISESSILAIALEKQTAYEGYKNNIDIFLMATGNSQTYSVNIPGVDLVSEVTHSFPLALPRTVVSFKPSLTKETIVKIITKVSKSSTVTPVLGVKGHNNCYNIETPSYAFLSFVRPYCLDNAPKTFGYSQIDASIDAGRIMHFIDLYLRTNTYPAFKDDDDTYTLPQQVRTIFPDGKRKFSDYGMDEVVSKRRYGTVSMTHKIGDETKPRKEEGFWLGPESDANAQWILPLNDVVLTAKPSPVKTSEASWSTPSQVPNLPGLLFPYFPGMLTPDKSAITSVVGTHFLRLFGIDYKKQFLAFKKSVGIFFTSDIAIALTHILAGVDLSITTQTKLHLLFDGSNYLGFCLLGAKWAIQRGSEWTLPLKSAELRAELDTIKTHQSSLNEVLNKLRELDIEFVRDIEDGCDLAELLAQVTFPEDEDEKAELYKWFDERAGRLDFGMRPENFNADSFSTMLTDIANTTESLNHYVHLPRAKFYHLFKHREAIALSRFGYLAPSFKLAKGTEPFRLASAHGSDTDDAARVLVKKVVVAMKPLDVAVKDFQEFRNLKTVYQGSSERASVYRLNSFGGAVKDRFLKSVGKIVTKIDASVGFKEKTENVKDKGKKRETAEEVIIVDLDDDALDF
jgi:hypothetical protein